MFRVHIESIFWKCWRIFSCTGTIYLSTDCSVVFSGLFELIYAVFTLSCGIRVIDQCFLFFAKGHDLFVEDFSVVADCTRLIFDWLCHRDLFCATSSRRSEPSTYTNLLLTGCLIIINVSTFIVISFLWQHQSAVLVGWKALAHHLIFQKFKSSTYIILLERVDRSSAWVANSTRVEHFAHILIILLLSGRLMHNLSSLLGEWYIRL